MSTIVGLDIGRRNTKVVSNRYAKIFVSSAMIKNNDYYGDNSITIDGSKYIVGHQDGNAIYNDDKSKDATFEACLYYALSQFDDTDFEVVTGLPINHYKLYKKALEDKYNGRIISIEDYSGELRSIRINNFSVKPEGVLCIEEEDDGDILIIDIGGLTVDVAQYRDKKLIKALSYELGVRKFYSYVAEELNKEFGTDYNIDDIERYVDKGQIVYENKVMDYDFTKYKLTYLQKIIIAIKDDFPWKKCIKKFVGGGSVVYEDILTEAGFYISKVAIYANASAFFEEGVYEYGE